MTEELVKIDLCNQTLQTPQELMLVMTTEGTAVNIAAASKINPWYPSKTTSLNGKDVFIVALYYPQGGIELVSGFGARRVRDFLKGQHAIAFPDGEFSECLPPKVAACKPKRVRGVLKVNNKQHWIETQDNEKFFVLEEDYNRHKESRAKIYMGLAFYFPKDEKVDSFVGYILPGHLDKAP
jgi:hypothetical protein